MEREVIDSFFDSFVRGYVDEAISLLKKKPSVRIDEFSRTLAEKVSSDFGVPKELVVYMSNPFHWEFFSNGNNIFELKDWGRLEDGGMCARFREGSQYSPEDARVLAEKIKQKYWEYFEIRMRTFSSKAS